MSKIDKTQNLTIDEVWPVDTGIAPQGGIGIDWFGSIGFGQFVLWWDNDDKLHADTEHLDIADDDRRFTKKILELLAERIVIES